MVLLAANCCSSIALKGGTADLYQLKISLGVLDVLFRILGSQYIRNHCGRFTINIQVLWCIILWIIPLISEASEYWRRFPWKEGMLINLGLWCWGVSAQPVWCWTECCGTSSAPCSVCSCSPVWGPMQHLLGWAGAFPLTPSAIGCSGVLNEIKWQLLM